LPNEFVGPEQRLEGLANASWGSVAIILRNGQPQRLVTPGSRFGRGWRAPLIGNLDYVQVNTDSAAFSLSVRGVKTRDSYHIGLKLDTRVKLNGADNYKHLDAFIRSSGRGFAEDLIAEVQRGLEQFAFQLVAGYDHADLREQSPSSAFARLGFPVAIGSSLLLVTSLSVADVTWDPKAIEVEDAEKDRIANVARARAESALGEERLQIFAPVAAQLGLPVEALAYPDRYAMSQQHAHEALLALLKPEMRMVWQRNPGMLDHLFARAGIGPATSPQHSSLTSAPFTQLPVGTGVPAEIIVEPEAEVELNRNLTLRRAWSAHEPGEVMGIEVGGRNSPTPTVIAVTASGRPPSAETVEALARAVGGTPRVLVLRFGTWQDLVEQWFRQAVPDAVGLRVSCAEVGDDLRIRVSGSPFEADRIVKRLNSPDDTVLGALEELVPFVRVDVELGAE